MLLSSIFIHVFLEHVFTHSQNCFQCYIQYFKIFEDLEIIESSIYPLNPIDLSEHLAFQTLLYPTNPLEQVFCQLLSITIVYSNLGFNSFYQTLLVQIFENFRPTSQHIVFCRFHSSPVLTKYILLEMCLVCLVSLILLAIHVADLLSNIMRGDSPRTISGSFFISSLFIILKCGNAILSLIASLY